ncbi:urease accessory protein UreD [Paragemmobacter straminiformis]|uniref:Urease accessory protein UreD n=1 Tax=Paragemmobacter straminiformis TaxID=2045119 RepID=A0A842I9R6_9RHOB|nr:urease accessory protein UreD [Gemmobacter straminiformis]MBC2836590.1 urease accessory protein UreD [Gemmobacter straminiformis]
MTAQGPISAMQRSRGEAFVSFAMAGARLRLGDLRQAGSAKAMLPHVGAVPEVVFLNTSGGLTGGDRLSYGVALGDGCRAVATTQTAERAYLSNQGAARVEVALSVGAGGWIDWLPQETILFDGSNLDRRTRIDLGAGAGCLALEVVVLGRAAMGEVVRKLAFRDRREIWAGGRPLHVEPLALDAAALGAGAATLGAARAFVSVVMVAPDAGDLLGPLRAVLDGDGVAAAASAYDGRLTLRMMAADGWPLRRQIARALSVLRRGAALPRVWQIGRDE